MQGALEKLGNLTESLIDNDGTKKNINTKLIIICYTAAKLRFAHTNENRTKKQLYKVKE